MNKTTRTKYGSIVYIAEGKYRVFWGSGRDENGKRKRQSKTVYGSRRDAETFLAKQAAGGYAVARAVTWAEFYHDHVTPTFEGLAAKTVQDYERCWRVELMPRIGAARVRDCTWQFVDTTLAGIESATVQKHVFALWRKMCNIAIRNGLLTVNPCTRQTRLKPHRKQITPLVCDVAEFMREIRGIKYESALLVMLGGGLRVEECFGLTWGDLRPHFANSGVYILANVKKAVTTAYNRPILKETKNAASVRVVVIGQPFAKRLEQLRGADAAPVIDCAPVTFTHNWREWCKRHGLQYVRPKDLRASYATLCGEAGCIDSLVSMQMGHADGTTKGRNYQRATVRGGMLVADMLAELIADNSTFGTRFGTQKDVIPGQTLNNN